MKQFLTCKGALLFYTAPSQKKIGCDVITTVALTAIFFSFTNNLFDWKNMFLCLVFIYMDKWKSVHSVGEKKTPFDIQKVVFLLCWPIEIDNNISCDQNRWCKTGKHWCRRYQFRISADVLLMNAFQLLWNEARSVFHKMVNIFRYKTSIRHWNVLFLYT